MSLKNIFSFIALVLATGGFWSCKTTQPTVYRQASKVYDSTTREIVRDIRQNPPPNLIVTADSIKIPDYQPVTTNFGLRRPNMVVIHHTAQNSCEQTLYTFSIQRTNVSAHYIICKDGTLHHMLNDNLRAWHAGIGKWGNVTDVNSSSIGIELDNNGFEPFAPAQMNTLLGLLRSLKEKYNIPTANFIGHSDLAPTRKNDPNVNFPWKALADSGFGYWYNDTTSLQVPLYFDADLGLRLIGYDLQDRQAAYQAFRRRFLATERKGPLTEKEKKVVYAVMQRYM